MGDASLLAAAQSIFVNRLLLAAPSGYAPAILETGATELRHTFSADDFPRVLLAYMTGLRWTFAMVVAVSGLTLPIALCAKWYSLNPNSTAPV